MYEVRLVISFLLLAISASALPGTRLDVPAPDEKIFNVLDYGAKFDVEVTDKFDSLFGFGRAFNAACHSKAKARVVIPKGGVFYTSQVRFSGPCETIGPIIVQIQGTVKATDDTSFFPNYKWIKIMSVDNLILLGSGGLLDGQASANWTSDKDRDINFYSSFASVHIYESSNIVVRNVHSINPNDYNFQIEGSRNIKLHRLRLSAHKGQPYTDGFNIYNSTAVRISKSVVSGGSECVTFDAGSSHVVVEKVTCTSGTGI